jgi:hypothetical protein
VFENGVLRKIFGPNRYDVTGEWRRRCNEELYNLYFSPDNIRVKKSRKMRWAGHVARMGARRGVYRVLLERRTGTRPLAKQRRRWEDDINMDLQEVGWGDVDWIDLAQDRGRWWVLLSAVMNLRVANNVGNFCTS